MRARVCVLLGLVVLVLLAASGCLGVKSGTPQAIFTASPTEHLTPFTANFDGTLSYDPDGEIISYLWNFGDGGAADGAQAAHLYEENGEYVVKLIVVDDRGHSASSTVEILALNPPPAATFSYSPRSVYDDEFIIGAGETVTFDGSASSDNEELVAYLWNFGDGTTANGTIVEHEYKWPGTYNVTLTVTDNDGGTTTYVEAVTVFGGQPCGGDDCPGGSCS